MAGSGSLVARLALKGCCVYDGPKMENQSERLGDHQKSGGTECGDRYNE